MLNVPAELKTSLLIALEGPDGCGKTTLSFLLAGFLRNQQPCSVVSFPSRTALGDFVRTSYTAETAEMLCTDETRLYLFAADAVNACDVVTANLKQGHTVILDRHPLLSALAYQVDSHPVQRIMTVLDQASQALYPDLVLMIHTDEAECERRRNQDHTRPRDSYTPTDTQRTELLYRRYAAALTLANYNAAIVDGDQDPAEMCRQCLRAIARVAEAKRKILLAAAS